MVKNTMNLAKRQEALLTQNMIFMQTILMISIEKVTVYLMRLSMVSILVICKV